MNDSPFGLTAAIWTEDVEAAKRIGDRIETGTVYMNRADYRRSGARLGRRQAVRPRRDAVARRLRAPDAAEELPPQNEDILTLSSPRC